MLKCHSGQVKVGDELEVIGLNADSKTTCTGVEMFKKLLDSGMAGDNIGALLRGLKREDVLRGQVLGLLRFRAWHPQHHFSNMADTHALA